MPEFPRPSSRTPDDYVEQVLFGSQDLYDAVTTLANSLPDAFADRCDCRMGDPWGHYLPQCPHPGRKVTFHGIIE
jgi:hypothetical protein